MPRASFCLLKGLWIGGAVALPLLLSACSNLPQVLDAASYYKRDMQITVNGLKAEGALVVPRSDSYALDIQAQGVLDLFTLQSCHRETSEENAGQPGIFGDKKRIQLTYHPVNAIENVSDCPLELGGYEKAQGRHSWGFIDFEDPSLTLPAKIKCNGTGAGAVGVSVCQSRQGLIEQIVFQEKVGLAKQPDPKCPDLPVSDGMTFQFKMPLGQCIYVFKGASGLHRLTTLGYEKILIRGS